MAALLLLALFCGVAAGGHIPGGRRQGFPKFDGYNPGDTDARGSTLVKNWVKRNGYLDPALNINEEGNLTLAECKRKCCEMSPPCVAFGRDATADSRRSTCWFKQFLYEEKPDAEVLSPDWCCTYENPAATPLADAWRLHARGPTPGGHWCLYEAQFHVSQSCSDAQPLTPHCSGTTCSGMAPIWESNHYTGNEAPNCAAAKCLGFTPIASSAVQQDEWGWGPYDAWKAYDNYESWPQAWISEPEGTAAWIGMDLNDRKARVGCIIVRQSSWSNDVSATSAVELQYRAGTSWVGVAQWDELPTGYAVHLRTGEGLEVDSIVTSSEVGQVPPTSSSTAIGEGTSSSTAVGGGSDSTTSTTKAATSNTTTSTEVDGLDDVSIGAVSQGFRAKPLMLLALLVAIVHSMK